MVIENQYPPYFEWLLSAGVEPGAIWIWLLTVVGLLVGGLLVSFVLLAVRNGPAKAGDLIYRTLAGTVDDLLHTSPRRVWALARLAVQESLRRRVLVGFGAFILILLFAGWFLNPTKTDPAKVYLSFVLTATSFLVLFLTLVLSNFSLPQDLQSKTIYTIVTKPVRPTEIVLGRVLGFVCIGTGLLAVMGVLSYFFVIRTLNHTHELTEDDLTTVAAVGAGADGAPPLVKTGRTGFTNSHRHDINRLDETGRAVTEPAQGHTHEITAVTADSRTTYQVGPPLGQLKARVPVYGKLSFRDRGNKPANKGTNVGNEWTYRSYIEGGSPAAAIWRFRGLRREDYPDKMILEMTLRVFRSFKGDIDRGILGSITLRNPSDPKVKHVFENFTAKEFTIDRKEIPLQFEDAAGREVDLFRDIVTPEGEMEIEIGCLERAQFFGMAQPDIYLLRREGSPVVNFAKGYVAIWLLMLLVTSFGVTFSTFLSGPIALLATVATLLGGFFIEFVRDLSLNRVQGGGMFESVIRIVQQENLTSELEHNVTNTVAIWGDHIARIPLMLVSRMLPAFGALNDIEYVSNGFNISGELLAIHLTMAAGYVIPVLLFGFIFFKLREVAA
jgi:hypothetical protein